MMRGIIVATTVWLRAPRNMASITQVIDALACRFGGGTKPPSSSRPLSSATVSSRESAVVKARPGG